MLKKNKGKNREELIIDNKVIYIYPADVPGAPVVFSNDYADIAEGLISACEKRGCPKFNHVSITKLNWNEELSPWSHPQLLSDNDNFTGGADDYLAVLEGEILPQAEEKMYKPGKRILSGYSMGGLFALYAAQKSEMFNAYVCASGSVWYPDFVEYVRKHEFEAKPKAIYLSIGDKESKTKHPLMSQTENNMRTLYSLYRKRGVDTTFVLNKGQHYKDPLGRMASGIEWTLPKIGWKN